MICTDAQISLHAIIAKYYNGLLGRQSSEKGRDEVTYFYVGTFFVYTLALSMPIFKKKPSQRFLEKMSKLFIVTTMKNLERFCRNPRKGFFLKIDILIAKVYTKKVPNIEVHNFIPASLGTLFTKQVIVVLYLG